MACYNELYYNMIGRSRTLFAVLIMVIIGIEAVSMGFLQKSLKGAGGALWAGLGMAGYAVVALVFREALRFASMAKANALWDAGSIVIVTLVGKVLYHNRYTARVWLGVVFAIAAVLCMA